MSVTNLGPKTALYLAMASGPPAAAELCAKVLLDITNIRVDIIPNYMVITLTPGNPIMHPR